jgi:hypothetical protein
MTQIIFFSCRQAELEDLERWGAQRRSHERYRHNEDNGRFADYFIHLLLGVKLRDALVRSTIWIQRIRA